jgi:tyrosine-protein kinase Etk/Wzc
MDPNNQLDHPPGDRNTIGYQEEMDDEINLIDLIYPIYKRRKFLIRFCLVIAIAAGVISLFLPKTYEATAVILPVSDQGNSSLTSGLASSVLGQFGLSNLSMLGLPGLTGSTTSKNFKAALKSNELANEVLNRYDYFSIMGINKKAENKRIKSIAGLIAVTESKTDNTISISVQHRDPVFASDLVNSYVKALDAYNLNNSFTSAGNLRKYVEKRLEEAGSELDQAQKDLRDFQEKNRAISISEQGQATLKVLAQMEAQRVVMEVQRSAKERFYKGSYSEIELLTSQIDALKKSIDQLTYSQDPSVPLKGESGKIEFYIPLSSITGLGFDESKLLLQVKAKTGVITLLTSQLEQAKLDEAKDIPTINILERSYPPEKEVKPKVVLNVVLGLVVSIFLGIFIIFFMEFIQRMDHDPDTAPKWLEMKKGIAGLFRLFGKTRMSNG